MKPAEPLVTVGMPAFNAAATIRQAIESILAQEDVGLELVVSDNASSDSTWQIIDEYRQRDPRVIGLRQVDNVGANANYTVVFRAVRGRYFKWTSSNDWCAPGLLSNCIAALERNPDAVLAAPRTRIFSESIEAAEDYDGDAAFDDGDPVTRFKRVLQELQLNNMINGVVRAEVLRRTPLLEHYSGADNVLLAHLALLGRLLLLPQPQFYRRMNSASATHLMSDEAVQRHLYPRSTARSLLPNWRFQAGLASAALHSGLSPWQLARALAYVARGANWRRRYLARDLIEAARYPLKH